MKIAFQLYPSTISKLSRISYVLFTSISVLYQLHPDHKILVSTPSMFCLTSDNIHISTYHLHPCGVSSPSRYRYSHLIPTQVVYHLQPALIMPTFMLVPSHPHTGRDMNIPSIHVPSHLHQGPYIHISSPSRSRFTPTHVQIFVSQLYPGDESTLSCS